MQFEFVSMEKETVAVLPDDALAGVLGRLPPRSLAASRCVCKAWRGLVDERRLLLPHLVPHSVGGFFVNFLDHEKPHFFARPTPKGAGPRIDGEFSFITAWEEPHLWHTVLDHCNGLVLFAGGGMYLCNPTTQRWARLPPRPDQYRRRAFVVFDPAVSPHWEVLLAPHEPHKEKEEEDGEISEEEEDGEISEEEVEEEEEEDAEILEVEEHGEISDYDGAWRTMEWPPPTWTWHVISSRTMRWEERVFVREGEAAGTVADLLLHSLKIWAESIWRSGAYCQGELYVHCCGEYVSRLSMSTNKYQVIKSPIDLAECHKGVRSIIGRSENGVYFAAVDYMARLRVWVLNGSWDEMEWQLKHNSVVYPEYEQVRYHGPWIFDDDYETGGEEEALQEHNEGWNSDSDNVIDILDSGSSGDEVMEVIFLGFHPYKEVIFLQANGAGVACHLNSTKIQYLGELSPHTYHRGLDDSFVYTPCLMGVQRMEV